MTMFYILSLHDALPIFIDTVHFPNIAKQYRFRGKGVYAITGKVMEEFDCISIEVSKMERLAMIQDPRYVIKTVERRSEEHTSELQSRPHLVCRLLLEKK